VMELLLHDPITPRTRTRALTTLRRNVQGKAAGGKRKKWPWVVGALVLLAVILGAVLGGVFGSRAANDGDNKSNNVAGSNNNGAASAATRTLGSGNEAVVPTVLSFLSILSR